MTLDRDLLARYLRQRRELGERDLLLDELTAAELLAALGDRSGTDSAAGLRERPSPSAVSPFALLRETLREGAPGASAAGGGSPAGSGGAGVDGAAGPVASRIPGAGEALRVLAAEVSGCTGCRLHEGRSSVVFGEGNPEAALVVVGEAPGFEEDRSGRPFVGRAGKLLDLLLLAVGYPREEVFICNVLKCRPPDNRDPLGAEIARCSPYLHRQLELISPRAVLAVGKFATQTLLETEESIGKLRGRVHAYRGTPLVATFHPAFLLRSPQSVRAAWQDLQLLREVIDAA